MNKQLFNEESKAVLITRIGNLKPDNKALWGDMCVNEMLYYCIKVNTEILNGKGSGKKPVLKQRIAKLIGLYLMKQFPKGVQSGARYFIPDNGNLNFIAGRNGLIENIHTIVANTSPLQGNHPFFGPLNDKEWHRFLWRHLDHHLKQFQV